MRKWLIDVADAQKRNGCVRSLAPHGAESWFVRGMDGSVGWADAMILACSWRLVGDTATITLRVPVNTNARICLPNGTEQVIAGGKHVFSVEAD